MFLNFLIKIDNFLFNKVTVAQLIERLAGELSSIPGPGEFFSLEFLLKEEMNQMEQEQQEEEELK